MTRNYWIVAAVVVVLVVLGFVLTRPQQPTRAPEPTPTPPTSTESASLAAPEGAKTTEETVVKITAAGFSPKDVTIKAGATVTWMNEDTAVHTVNSAVHPTHQVYPPLNLGNIQPGGKVSLTFPTAGTYKYHDHLNPSLTGSVIVE